MIILVISDLHLDNQKDPLGYFRWDEDAFISRLDRAIETYDVDQVFINGDLFELYRYTRKEISRSYPKIRAYLKSKNVIHIRGNHDSISKTGVDFYDFVIKGKRFHLEHGHMGDLWNGVALGRKTSRLLMKSTRLLSAIPGYLDLHLGIYRFLEKRKALDGRRKNDFKYLMYAMRLLNYYDVVFLGHTHEIEEHRIIYKEKEKYYFNSGTCSNSRFHAVVVNTETMDYELIREEDNS